MTENLRPREKLPIISIPIALKTFRAIVLCFQTEKLLELRVARHEPLGFRELVVSQVIASAASDSQIDQTAKGPRRRFDSSWCMQREEIEDDARIRFFGPRQKALIVFFDQSYCAVDDDCPVRTQQFSGGSEEVGKISAWNVYFGNDKARLLASDLLTNLVSIIRKIGTQLICVRPVSLSVRGQIVIAVSLESLFAIRVSKPQEIQPVIIAQFLFGDNLLVFVDRLVTGKHSTLQKIR